MLDLVAATGLRDRTARAAGDACDRVVEYAEPVDTIELTVHTAQRPQVAALPYVVFEAGARASLDGFDDVAKIETDVVHGDGRIVAHRRAFAAAADARRRVDAAAASRPTHAPAAACAPRTRRSANSRSTCPRSPTERGWCTPAVDRDARRHVGNDRDVADVAAAVFDRAYDGTGNWTFAVAYAGTRGLAGAAAYLRDLVNVEALHRRGNPARAQHFVARRRAARAHRSRSPTDICSWCAGSTATAT